MTFDFFCSRGQACFTAAASRFSPVPQPQRVPHTPNGDPDNRRDPRNGQSPTVGQYRTPSRLPPARPTQPRRPLREMRPSCADKSPGRQAKPQLLAVWWLLKQITAPGPRPRSSTNDLAPPRRMGWVSLQPYRSRLVGGRKRAAVAVALPPRAPRTVGPRVSLPPEAGALKESSHVWAGFWLRGVQP